MGVNNGNGGSASIGVYAAFGQLLSSIPGGVIQFEIAKNCKVSVITDKMLKLVGCSRLQFAQKYNDDVRKLIYPEDFENVKSTIKDNLHNKDGIEFECRMVTYEDSVKWFAVTVQILASREGFFKAYAVILDIDKVKRTKDDLEHANNRYKMMLDLNSDIHFDYNVDDDVMLFNSNEVNDGAKIKNYVKFSEKLQNSIKIADEDKEKILKVSEINDSTEVEFRFFSVDGSCVWCLVKAMVYIDEKSNKKHIIGWINNIDKQKREEEYQKEKSHRDELTRLYSAEYTKELIEQELEAEDINDPECGVHAMILIDINHFDYVNEKYGEVFGDAVLMNIADCISSQFYQSDIVGRIGGDDFLILMKNIDDLRLIKSKLDNIQDIFDQIYSPRGAESGIAINCIASCALFPDAGTTYQELLGICDRAVSMAKRRGTSSMMTSNSYDFSNRKSFSDSVESIDNEAIKEEIEEESNEEANNIEKSDELYEKVKKKYKVYPPVKKQKLSAFNREITTFALEVMTKTDNIDSAIMLILDKIGRQFNVTHAVIFEANDRRVDITYTWSQTGGDKKYEKTSLLFDKQRVEEYQKNFDKFGVFRCDDVDTLKEDIEIKYLLKERCIQSFLQGEIVDDGNFEGCIGLFDCNQKRIWTQDETESLATITRIIATYLLKMRTAQRMEARLDEVKSFDGLTSLPTLYKFKQDASAIIADNHSKKYAVLSVDFINFKYINDNYGYETGDRLMRSFAKYICKSNMKSIINCRVSSDNFLMLIDYDIIENVIEEFGRFSEGFEIYRKETKDEEKMDAAMMQIELKKSKINMQIATSKRYSNMTSSEMEQEVNRNIDKSKQEYNEKLEDVISKLPDIDTIKVKFNCGACVIENNRGDIMVPIDNSNIARKHARENALEHCFFFNDEMAERIRTEFFITNEMEKALLSHEFRVYLQPKVNLSDGTLAGAEALVRWVRPDKSIMPPDKFIPLFEKNGFVVNLDFFVYDEVCKMIRNWIDRGIKPVPISVNVSRVHLYDEGFVDEFLKVINKYDIPNKYIELELTESMFLDNTEMTITTMRKFRSLGFKVSIDDFGAGYSSLNLLKEMTTDVLKLDKGFFSEGEMQKEEQIIVSSIVNMAKQLNMKVLSEGVETSAQSKFLKDIDCDLAQGYLFAKPMPIENFEVIMSNNLQFNI